MTELSKFNIIIAMSFKDTQKEESKTWLIGDPDLFKDKKQRETIRYPLIKKQMGLDYLDTTGMLVFDIGAGPFGGVSSVLKAKTIIRYDPLKNDYAKIADISTYSDIPAEDVDYSDANLVISTNAIDHFEDPDAFFLRMVETMDAGAYFAHFHAINNAVSHPHVAHEHNINPEIVNHYLKDDFECVWYLDYQHDGLTYGWRKQEAFCGLYRKVTGYEK